MTVLPWWRAHKQRRRAMDLQCAEIDQEIGSRLDAADRITRIRDEVERLRRAAEIIQHAVRDTSDGSFARGAVWAYDRALEVFDEP